MSFRSTSRRGFALTLIPVVLALTAGAHAQPVPRGKQGKLRFDERQTSRFNEKLGRIDRKARQPVRSDTEDPRAARLALEKARVMQRIFAHRKDTAIVFQALGEYETAVNLGTPQQVAVARNNLGVFLLAQGQATAAWNQLEAIKFNSVPTTLHPRIQFNQGLALESVGMGREAFDKYLEASKGPGAINAAGVNALQISTTSAWATPQTVVAATGTLHTPGQKERALPYVYDYLGGTRTTADAGSLPDVVMRFCADAVDQQTYLDRDKARLTAIGEENIQLAAFSKTIDRVYLGTLANLATGETSAKDEFADTLAVVSPEAMSSFLTKSAYARDGNTRAEDATETFSRYFAAWQLDPTNLDAAFRAASLLRRSGSGEQTLKALANIRHGAGDRPFDADEFARLADLHRVLASIYAERGRTGPIDNWETELGQLARAAKAEKESAEVGGADPSPYLPLRIARTLEEAGGEREDHRIVVARWYTLAARLCVKEKAWDDARDAVEKAGVFAPPSSRMSAEIARLKVQIERAG